VVSSGVAAAFLTQLGQLLRTLGWSDAPQLVAQSAVLLLVVLARALLPQLAARARGRAGDRAPASDGRELLGVPARERTAGEVA
jgi:ribose transport system permease protein